MNRHLVVVLGLNLGLGVVMLSLSACGSTAGSGVTTTTSDITNALTADNMSETADSIADDSSTSATLELYNYNPESVTLSRACTGGGTAGTAVKVVGTYSGSNTATVKRAKLSVATTITESGTLTRTWTPPASQTIHCNVAADHVRIPWETDAIVNGLGVTQTVDRTRDASRTVTVTATNTSTTITNNFGAKGTRTVSWLTGTGVSGSQVTREKTITSTITRTSSVTALSGTTVNLSSAVTVDQTTPLVVDVIRNNTAPYALVSKTVKSGKVTSTRAGTDRIEAVYANVFFDFSSATPCLPTSGTVTVSYFSPDTATTASSSSTITFGASTDSSVSLTPSSGTAVDFPSYPETGCELEKEI